MLPKAFSIAIFAFTVQCVGQETELFQAARNGDIERLKLFVSDKANARLRGPHGRTALHEAAANCKMEAALLLLKSGWDGQAKDDQGLAPLNYALTCPRMSTQVLELFLRGPMEPNSLNSQQGSGELSWKSEKYFWSLHGSIARGHVDLVAMLLKMGTDVNALSSEGNRPLNISCLKGDLPMTRLLLEHGASPSLRSKAGTTPLHDAALGGNPGVIELLIQHGAGVNEVDPESNATPLHHAASFGRLDAVKALIRGGAKVCAKTKTGLTPEQLASQNNQQDIASFLSSMRCGN